MLQAGESLIVRVFSLKDSLNAIDPLSIPAAALLALRARVYLVGRRMFTAERRSPKAGSHPR